MVLPLIGLLALGAGAAGRGQIGAMFDRQDARNFQRSGVDFRGRGLGQAGDLAQDIFSSGMGRRAGMQEMIGQTFGQQQADASNATRIRAAGISAAAGLQNAALNREKWELQKAEKQAGDQALIDMGANPELIASPGYRDSFLRAYSTNADEIRHAGMTPVQIAEMEARRALVQQSEAATAEANIRTNQEQAATSESRVAAENRQNEIAAQQGIYDPVAVETAISEGNQVYEQQIAQADNIINNVDELARLTDLGDEDAISMRASVQQSAFALEMGLMQEIYGDREASPQIYERFDAIMRDVGTRTENREATKRFFREIRAEAQQRAAYNSALIQRRNGMNVPLPPRHLSPAQRRAFAQGTDVPSGLSPGRAGGNTQPIIEGGVALPPRAD